MEKEKLDSLENLAKEATPEWKAQEHGTGTVWHEFEIRNKFNGVLFRSTSYGNMKPDAEYIAALSPDVVLELIAEVKRLRIANEVQDDLLGGKQNVESFRAQLAEAREVIDHYGDLDNWNRTRHEIGPISGHKYEIWEMDGGPYKARAYLEKYK